MDASTFKAPKILKHQIWQKAEEFRARYWPSGVLPINIERIAERDLGLYIDPVSKLFADCNIDALLLGDLKTVIVDLEMYMDDRMQNRMRFSLAHEVGHLVLHSTIYSEIAHSSKDEWIRFYEEVPDNQYSWVEQHAYEFAGRLLVPREILEKEFERARLLAENSGFTEWDSSRDVARDYIAKDIARVFAVSDEVISKRLIREGLLPL